MKLHRTPFLIVVLALVVTSVALAAPERPAAEDFATVRLGAGQLDFEVTTPYDRAVVTVSGRGLDRRTTQRFKAGEPLSVPLLTDSGEPLRDGMYRYTLRIHPRPEEGSGITTGIFYIEDSVTRSRDEKRQELASVRAELNRDKQAWLAKSRARIGQSDAVRDRRPASPSRDMQKERQTALSKPSAEHSQVEPIQPPPQTLFGYYLHLDAFGTPVQMDLHYFGIAYPYLYRAANIDLIREVLRTDAPQIANYAYGSYANPNGSTITQSFGYYPANWRLAYGFDGDGINYDGADRNYRYATDGNYDFGRTNVRSAYYGNYDFSYRGNNRASYYGNSDIAYGSLGINYFYAGWYNEHRAPFNVNNALYANYEFSGYGNYAYAFYGNDLTFAYGQFLYGDPYYSWNGNISLFAGGYDLGTLSYVSTFLNVQPFGVGVNTYYPGADLEVYDFNDFAALRLNNYYYTWTFAATPIGDFTINNIDSGGQEFTVRERFDVNGPTLDVQGSVKGTQFIASSSRDLKTDFTALDSKEVLARLSEIPVMSWRFKTEEESKRHVGPIAEDFQAAFQLGDGKTISNIDAYGVTMSAVQGLHELVSEQLANKDRQIAELTARLAALEERLEED